MLNQFNFNEIKVWTRNFQRKLLITVQTKQAVVNYKYIIILLHPYNKRYDRVAFCRTFYETEDVCDMIKAIEKEYSYNNYSLTPKAKEFLLKYSI